MTISPLPSRGDVIVGRDVAGRTLRISGHPKSGRVVLSIWQDTVCRATLRLAPEDVPQFVEMLTRSAIEPADPASAGVRPLHGHSAGHSAGHPAGHSATHRADAAG